jgi:rhamnulokinase
MAKTACSQALQSAVSLAKVRLIFWGNSWHLDYRAKSFHNGSSLMSLSRYLAFDLGAESGRAVLGNLQDGRLSIHVVHRFPNGPVSLAGNLHWDVGTIFAEIKKGLAAAARVVPDIESVAVDTWGVDFGFMNAEGHLLGAPYCYRDVRHLRAMKAFLNLVPPDRLYRRTGLQLLPFNTLFQLYAHVLEKSDELRAASRILFMPGLLTFLLSGTPANDATIASTSQLAEPDGTGWCEDLFAVLGLPVGLMGTLIPPGTTVGRLHPSLRSETGCPDLLVTAAAGHDTASAVAAVPAEGEDWAYLSSGTWSLLGLDIERPIITAASRGFNFTNERGLDGRIRFLKNISGLWLLQRCRHRWCEAEPLSYEMIWAQAAAAPAFRSFIDPEAPEFLNPPDMPAAIREFCRRTGQDVPDSPAEISRCALESLALKYRSVLEELREASGRPIRRIHVIGGGSQNELLNAFTAAATGLPVLAGPVEATAIGNILVQALAQGRVRSPEEIRAIVARSFARRIFEPGLETGWDDAYDRFRKILGTADREEIHES